MSHNKYENCKTETNDLGFTNTCPDIEYGNKKANLSIPIISTVIKILKNSFLLVLLSVTTNRLSQGLVFLFI